MTLAHLADRIAVPRNIRSAPAPVEDRIPPPGTLGDLLRLLGVPACDLHERDRLPTTMRRLRAGTTLIREGAPLEFLYFVRDGSLKLERTREDGYVQVLGLAGRAEVIGFEAICTRRHASTVIALEDATVYALSVSELAALRARMPALDQAVQSALSAQLARAADTVEVMSAVASEVRLARFLILYATRMAQWGRSSNRFQLRLSRRDIASLLGVAHETVSRSFGELITWGYLRVARREVDIIDLDGLTDLARNTRGLVRERIASAGARSAVAAAKNSPSTPRAAGNGRAERGPAAGAEPGYVPWPDWHREAG